MKTRINRRTLLRDGCLVTTGIAAGALLPMTTRAFLPLFQGVAAADEVASSSEPEQRLRQLGIELPPPPNPVAVYVPVVRVGNMLYASGHGPREADGKLIQGKVGRELSLQQGYAAARLVGLNMLSSVRHALGSLDHVVRLVKVLGMVNCTPQFTDQPKVINGFSELMVQVFGEEAGRGARSAVGMNSLPSNIAVEIEAIFQVRA